MTTKLHLIGAAPLLLALTLSGCGSDDHDDANNPPVAADAFITAVQATVANSPDDAEPVSIDAIAATAPEDSEPIGL